MLLPLDHDRPAVLDHFAPQHLNPTFDPGNQYTLPYQSGTGTPNAGGLTTREFAPFFLHRRAGAAHPRPGYCEIAPPLDHADMTTAAAIKVIPETLSMIQAKGNKL